jgi:hypothetical protein
MLLVTLHILSIHRANGQLNLQHHYYTLPSNLQHLNMFKNGATRETLRLTLGLGKTSTPSFVGSCRPHKISIFSVLMHGPYNYISLLHFCKVSSKSVIVKVLLQFGHYDDRNWNVTWLLYLPCFWQKGVSFSHFLSKSCQPRTLSIHIDYALPTRITYIARSSLHCP